MSKKKPRVVITGLGIVAPSGIGVKNFWANVKKGRSAISSAIQLYAKDYPFKNIAYIENYRPENYFDEKFLNLNTKFSQFALIAAKEAFENSRLTNYDFERLGVYLGTSLGGTDYATEQHSAFLNKGPVGIDSFFTSISNPSSATKTLSLHFKAKASCATFSSTCVASTDAIGFGADLIRKGDADIMIVGGAEAPINPFILSGFALGRILSNHDCRKTGTPRPFDLKRDGTVLAEGAAVLILEELEHALRRKANIYGEVIGYGSTNDGYHTVIPDPEGTQAVRAIDSALNSAGVTTEEVDYINAHGTGTVRNDAAETLIIKKVFGSRAYKIPVSGTKSITGHALGAAGAFEAVICLLGMQNNIIPPTINYENKDENCDLDYVPNYAREKKLEIVVSNSFGFGGFNSVLIFKKFKNK